MNWLLAAWSIVATVYAVLATVGARGDREESARLQERLDLYDRQAAADSKVLAISASATSAWLVAHRGLVNCAAQGRGMRRMARRIASLTRALAAEKERRAFFEKNVVWGFYEDAEPHFTQGGPDAKLIELHEAVTAEQVAGFVRDIRRLQADLLRIAKECDEAATP